MASAPLDPLEYVKNGNSILDPEKMVQFNRIAERKFLSTGKESDSRNGSTI